MLKTLCVGVLLVAGCLTWTSWSAAFQPRKMESTAAQADDESLWQSDAAQRHRRGQAQHWRAFVLVRN